LTIFCIFTLRSQTLYFPPLTGSQWDTLSASSLGWNTTALGPLYSFLDSNNTRAFIVLKDGKIVLEKYFGTFTRDSSWYWASAGKTMTSVLVGIAQAEGALSLSDTSSKWLGRGWTSEPLDKENRITLRHQLTMTTGLDDNVPDKDCTLSSCLVYKADAGTRWAYHNAPYTILDSVLSRATGLTLNQFFLSRVRTKIGMNGFYLRSGDYNNVLYSTPRSMARFGLLMLNKGWWGTTAVLQDSAYFNAMVSTSQSINPSYGYLWWLNGKSSHMLPGTQLLFPGSLTPSAPRDMFAALGKNGQLINIVPSMGLVFVRMGDAPDNSLVPTTLNTQIWDRLASVLQPATHSEELSTGPVPREPGVLQNYPNPFNPETNFEFRIANSGLTRLAVHDLLGREVAVLVDQERDPGTYTVRWNPADLPSGVYFARLSSSSVVHTRRIILLR
jgi:CubicO group peptidase (beta-lactamase class C family)